VRNGNVPAIAERLGWASDALHAAATVSAALRLGLLTALDAGPVRAEDVARDRDPVYAAPPLPPC
jgi:hypothetical protein